MSYRVTGAYVMCKILDTPTGKPTMYGFYEGAILPPSADPDNVAMLERKGLVKDVAAEPKVEEPAKAEVKADEPVAKTKAAKA